MPIGDIFHNAVRKGLSKEGWTVTDDPFKVMLPGLENYEDSSAAETLAAEKGSRQIVVTIKSFVGPSLLYDFYEALGRFMNYRLALEMQSSDRTLFLGVPVDTYEDFFSSGIAELAIREEGVKLMVFDVEKEEVVEWIS
ncbi:MAG: element excision factor XisH family protein [Blastocatellia bacterium]